MSRIPPIQSSSIDRRISAVLEAQVQTWGAPLANHLVYARRPSIFRGARGMWAGLAESGLIPPGLIALINRRVAAVIGCEF